MGKRRVPKEVIGGVGVRGGGGGGGGLKLGVEVEGRKGCRNGQEDFPSLFI